MDDHHSTVGITSEKKDLVQEPVGKQGVVSVPDSQVMEPPFLRSTGANESQLDSRTISHQELKTLTFLPLLQGGFDYLPSDVEDQYTVGICTAISLVQNAEKVLGIRLSPDFQYLLQKKYYDGNWEEGSSILSALKVGKNYGFLPVELLPQISVSDRQLPYSEYIAKLQAIPQATVDSLIAQCSDYKLDGYASVDVTDPQKIASAILASKAGILCMYRVGNEWYTSPTGKISWQPSDIDPIRPPKVVDTGHAITYAKFDYTTTYDGIHANTWGTTWDRQGLCNIVWNNYKPVEGWIPYFGLNEIQIEELKSKLQTQVGLLQKIIALWTALKKLGGSLLPSK